MLLPICAVDCVAAFVASYVVDLDVDCAFDFAADFVVQFVVDCAVGCAADFVEPSAVASTKETG